MTSPRFWAWEWIESNDVTSIDDAARALRRRAPVEQLQRLASEWEPHRQDDTKAAAVLAGSGADLSLFWCCPGEACRRRLIDRMFKKIWHYFDEVVVLDIDTHNIAHHWDSSPKIIGYFLSLVQTLLYLHEIDAVDLVSFRAKSPVASDWPTQLRRAGISGIKPVITKVSNKYERAMDGLSFSVDGNTASYTIDSEGDSITHSFKIRFDDLSQLSNHEIGRAGMCDFLDKVWGSFVSDLIASKRYRIPLGAVLSRHQDVLAATDSDRGPQVALELSLPVVDEIPIRELIALRNSERDSFIRFRQKLKRAIEERVQLSGATKKNAELAREIEADLILPELARIRNRLRVSEKILAKKGGIGIALGALATTCGLLGGVPMSASLSAGVATAIATTANASMKHLDFEQETRLDDMYFLWQAVGHAQDH